MDGRTEDEVVAFGEADGIVYLSRTPDEVITRGTVWSYHVDG